MPKTPAVKIPVLPSFIELTHVRHGSKDFLDQDGPNPTPESFFKFSLDPTNIDQIDSEQWGLWNKPLEGSKVYLKRPLERYADGSSFKVLYVRETRQQILDLIQRLADEIHNG